MARLLLVLGLVWLLYTAVRAVVALPPAGRRRVLGRLGWVIALALGVLVVTGRVHWLLAVLAPLAVGLRWLPRLLLSWPLLARLFSTARGPDPGPQHAGAGPHQGPEPGAGPRRPPPGGRPGTMTREEALEILGLEPGASREQIAQAHRRLMQKMHPDAGGTDYLAAQINRARDVLLERR
jgi:hypothetical protein